MQTLRHIPPLAIRHIPGPRTIGSRKPDVLFGILYAVGEGGVPTGQMVHDYIDANGGAPVWFAVSDGGAGFIPWGSWQVACYKTGDFLPPENLAFGRITCGTSDPSAAVAGNLWGKFQQLRAQGIAAGFAPAVNFQIVMSAIQDGLGPTPAASVDVIGPYGAPLTGFYVGPQYRQGGEGPAEAMMAVNEGYDNPLFMALWAPGSRAVIKCNENPGPVRYPRYPYPYEPYYTPVALPS
jgi:hypothetical protein